MISSGVRLEEFNVEDVRERLRKMTDAQLLGFGKAVASVCRFVPEVNETPRREFVIQLEEARAEWKRRKEQEVVKA